MTCTLAGAVAAVGTETIWSPSIKISALTTGASRLPSIKRPARMAIFLGVAFSFSCAEPANSAEIKKQIAIAAAAPDVGRLLAPSRPQRYHRHSLPAATAGRRAQNKK